MLADELDFVVGVDPHRDAHALAVVEVRTGVVVVESSVAADSGGYAEALRVAERHAPGRRAFAVEGTGSFGAGLTRFLAEQGEQVFEVGRLRRERRPAGKTDALDAVRAARSVFEQKRLAFLAAMLHGSLDGMPAGHGVIAIHLLTGDAEGFAAVMARTANMRGNAVISIDASDTITLGGVSKASLFSDDFAFV